MYKRRQRALEKRKINQERAMGGVDFGAMEEEMMRGSDL